MAANQIIRKGITYFLYNNIPIRNKLEAKAIIENYKGKYHHSRIIPSKDGYNIYFANKNNF